MNFSDVPKLSSLSGKSLLWRHSSRLLLQAVRMHRYQSHFCFRASESVTFRVVGTIYSWHNPNASHDKAPSRVHTALRTRLQVKLNVTWSNNISVPGNWSMASRDKLMVQSHPHTCNLPPKQGCICFCFLLCRHLSQSWASLSPPEEKPVKVTWITN